jgi:hypothetical protein
MRNKEVRNASSHILARSKIVFLQFPISRNTDIAFAFNQNIGIFRTWKLLFLEYSETRFGTAWLWNEAYLTSIYAQNMFSSMQINVISSPKMHNLSPAPKTASKSRTKKRVHVKAQKYASNSGPKNQRPRPSTKSRLQVQAQNQRPIRGPKSRVQVEAQKPLSTSRLKKPSLIQVKSLLYTASRKTCFEQTRN